MGQKRVSQNQGSCAQPSRAICHQRLADTERKDGVLTPRLHFSIFSRKTSQKRLQSHCTQHVWFQLLAQKGKWGFPDSGRLPTATPKSPSPLLFPSEVFLKSIDSSGNENLQPAIRIKGNSPNLRVARVFIRTGCLRHCTPCPGRLAASEHCPHRVPGTCCRFRPSRHRTSNAASALSSLPPPPPPRVHLVGIVAQGMTHSLQIIPQLK